MVSLTTGTRRRHSILSTQPTSLHPSPKAGESLLRPSSSYLPGKIPPQIDSNLPRNDQCLGENFSLMPPPPSHSRQRRPDHLKSLSKPSNLIKSTSTCPKP